jgi:hypothetical protein
MDAAYNVSSQAAPVDAGKPRSSVPLRALRAILLPLGLILWGFGVAETNTDNLGPYGLPPVLPLVFYAGLAVLIVSAGIEFSRPRLSEFRLAPHAVALVVILYGTAPLVYQEGRYAWLYKTIGVVRYVSVHGSLNRSVDIYQSWPGFFAAAAWFDNVAGVGSPLGYAKWAQLAFELAAIPLLYTIYHAVGLPAWHRWLAIMLYAASNWIAQDYFSPQGLSTLLSLGVMAVVARWMLVVGPPGRWRRDAGSPGDEVREAGSRPAMAIHLRSSGPFLIILVFLFFVLTATHELSPYIIVIQIASLAIIGLARPRWIALAVAAIAIGYLLPNFSYVNSHYGLLSSAGSFFSNVQPPAESSAVAIPESHRFISDCTRALSGGIWLLALAGAWLRRKYRRMVLALLLLTFTPVLVLVAGAYGNEGILRVYLFSLPWAVMLAACALAPLRDPAESSGHGALRAVVPLALALALFFPSFFGDDGSNVMTPSEVNTTLSFLQSAKPGPVLDVLGNAPGSDIANYNKFPVGTILDADGLVPNDQVPADMPSFLARTMTHYYAGSPAYVVMTPSMSAYNETYGVTASDTITTLLAGLAKSPYWTLVASNDGTKIYRLSAAARTMPSGPYSSNVVLGSP